MKKKNQPIHKELGIEKSLWVKQKKHHKLKQKGPSPFEKQYMKAVKKWEKIVINEPSFQAYYSKGVCEGLIGNYDDARKSFENALNIIPKNDNDKHLRAILLWQLNRSKQALEILNELISKHQKIIDPYLKTKKEIEEKDIIPYTGNKHTKKE